MSGLFSFAPGDRWLTGVFTLMALVVNQAASADDDVEKPFQAKQFLQTYCLDCHTQDDPSGQREFENLALTKSDLDTQISVQEIIDQLTLSTMPPEDGDQPSSQERLRAINALTSQLAAMREQTASTGGQTVLRRLSRREYRQTIGDLLQIDMTMFDPTIEFPSDNLSGHFDNVGAALVTSGHLLERYLEAADQCVEKALAIDEKPEPQSWVFRDYFYQQPELRLAHKAAFDHRFLCLYDHPLTDKPEGAYGHLDEFRQGVPMDGVYEVRVHAKAMHRDSPYSNQAVRIDLDEPFRLGVRPGDTSIEDMVHRQPLQPKLAETVIADDQFHWYTFQIPLDQGFAPRFTFENGIHDVRGSFARVVKMHADTLPEKVRRVEGISKRRVAVIQHGRLPHIRIDEVQIRGPIEFAWPTAGQKMILGGVGFHADQAIEHIQRFATRAFRRPLMDPESRRLADFYQSQCDAGRPPWNAFKDTLKAILCSPEFLYFQSAKPGAEKARPSLTAHAVAERLSYFLTSSIPDDRLLRLANSGEILEASTLRQETRRLLRDKRSDRFVADFLDSWLGLRSLGSMPPDPNEFWFFYAADLQNEMKQETRRFFRDALDRNVPVSELIDARHSFVNRDLAKLYGIEEQVLPENAAEFRRVEFGDPRRGGLLGQASIATVSANGIETSPVVRGVWLLENILGTPTPPPPDDVPTIEPDVRGAKTIRDQLTKHRENEACYQCHRKIDPLGFAMETFDAIGQTRAFYDSKRKSKIDTSGELPGGRHFDGIAGMKQELIRNRQFFARTLTERLLTHALGREIEASDRAAVEAILTQNETKDYPVADLIESIVASELFSR